MLSQDALVKQTIERVLALYAEIQQEYSKLEASGMSKKQVFSLKIYIGELRDGKRKHS